MNKQKARELLQNYCQVCNRCDGRACAGEVPGMGGAGTGSSFMANFDSLKDVKFKMKVLANDVIPSTATKILGKDLDIPVFAAPIAGVKFNMGGGISEENYVHSVLEGCIEMNTIGCTGDAVPDYIFETGINVINSLDGNGIPFIKPWENEELFKKLEIVADNDLKIAGIDIDAIGLSTIEDMGKTIKPRKPDQLKEIINEFPQKIILKGIMTPEEAKKAVDIGADAIVVSNHGGRVLDHTPGVAEVLPKIAARVKDQITILSDGGVRSGADVLKMLALGADAVMIGRSITIAAFSDLNNGVKEFLEKIKLELKQSLLLTGCEDIQTVNSDIIYF